MPGYKSLRKNGFGFLLLLTALGCQGWAQPDSLVKENLIHYFTAQGYDILQSPLAEALVSLEASAAGYSQSQNANGSWPDLTYSNAAVGSGIVYNHFVRIWTLSQAWATQGQSYFGSSALLAQIENGLDWVNQTYRTGISHFSITLGLYGNWWWWYIGIPSQLGPTLLLLENQIDQEIYEDALASLDYFTAPNGQFPPPIVTGQNVIDISMAHFYHALITQNQARLELIQSTFESVCSLTEQEGIQPDYSFHQHGPTLATGSYGADFAHDVSLYIMATIGTDYALNQTSEENFFRFMGESFAWGPKYNYWDPSLIGRGISRASHSAYLAITSLLHIAPLAPEPEKDLVSYSKKLLETWPTTLLPVELAGRVHAVQNLPEVAREPLGFRNFPHSDYAVMRQPLYYASLKMHSTRTRATDEFLNSEGKKSWHLSDGFTYFALEGFEYYANNIWALFDWERVPGTTVERKSRSAGSGYGTGALNFTGGVSDSTLGLTAMDFAPNTSDVTGKKSWHWMPEGILCLGSGITSSSGNGIETIINQRPLALSTSNPWINNSETPLSLGTTLDLEQASSLYFENFGYYFPAETDAFFAKQNQSGSWSEIGAGDAAIHTFPMYQFWIDHGTNPSQAKYAYAVLPGITLPDFQAFTQSPAFEILSLTDSVHAVWFPHSGKRSGVFWQPGRLGNLEVSRPGGVIWRQTDSTLKLDYSPFVHPAQNFSFVFDGRLVNTTLPPGGSSIFSQGRTTVSFAVEKGNTYSFWGQINRPPRQIAWLDSLVWEEDTDTVLRLSEIFSDADQNDQLAYSGSSTHIPLIWGEGDSLLLAPVPNWAGQDTLRIVARDSWGDSLSLEIPLVVLEVNDFPQFNSETLQLTTQMNEGDFLRDSLPRVDAEGDTLIYTILTGPAGLTNTSQIYLLEWLPGAEQAGTHPVTLQYSDGIEVSTFDYQISVNLKNHAPVIDSIFPSIKSIVEGDSLCLVALASDINGDSLAYLWIGHSSDTLSHSDTLCLWFDFLSAGLHSVTALVWDSALLRDSLTLNIQVLNQAIAPTILNDSGSLFSDTSSIRFGWEAGRDPDLDSASQKFRLHVFCYPETSQPCFTRDTLADSSWQAADPYEFFSVVGDSFLVSVSAWDSLGYVSPPSPQVKLLSSPSQVTGLDPRFDKASTRAAFHGPGNYLEVQLGSAKGSPRGLLVHFQIQNLKGISYGTWQEMGTHTGNFRLYFAQGLPVGLYLLSIQMQNKMEFVPVPIF